MIEIHKDALGNISGFWDTELNCWVPPTEGHVAAAELEEGDQGQATDSDDAGEPVPEPDFESMTKQQLLEWLTNSGVDVSTKDSKADLLEQAQTTFAAQQATE